MANEMETPKYLLLKEALRARRDQGSLINGQKIPSENELARDFGISRQTVRQAVGELVSEGLLYRIKGSGTYVSHLEGEKREKSGIIGVMVTYLDDYIFPGIIKGIDEVLSQNGRSIILGCTYNKLEREAACLQNMLDKNVDGLIVEPTKSALPNPNLIYYERLKKERIPFLFINGYYPALESSYVIEDDELSGYLAANHLFELGHEAVGGIFKIDDIQGHGRYGGMSRAHREHKKAIPEEAVVWYTTENREELFSGENGNALIEKFKKCTAVICYNDQIAQSLMELFLSRGIKVPEAISVVGFDDSELAVAGSFKLTTLAHPKEELGKQAAQGLLRIIGGRQKQVREKMLPRLIVRNTTDRKK